MITGTTQSGFAFALDDDVMDDYELLETLQAMDEGNTSEVVNMAALLLGKEQKNALKEHLRGENGRVPAGRMVSEILEILQASGKGKN